MLVNEARSDGDLAQAGSTISARGVQAGTAPRRQTRTKLSARHTAMRARCVFCALRIEEQWSTGALTRRGGKKQSDDVMRVLGSRVRHRAVQGTGCPRCCCLPCSLGVWLGCRVHQVPERACAAPIRVVCPWQRHPHHNPSRDDRLRPGLGIAIRASFFFFFPVQQPTSQPAPQHQPSANSTGSHGVVAHPARRLRPRSSRVPRSSRRGGSCLASPSSQCERSYSAPQKRRAAPPSPAARLASRMHHGAHGLGSLPRRSERQFAPRGSRLRTMGRSSGNLRQQPGPVPPKMAASFLRARILLADGRWNGDVSYVPPCEIRVGGVEQPQHRSSFPPERIPASRDGSSREHPRLCSASQSW